MVRRGLLSSVEEATAALARGEVRVAGVLADNPGRLVAPHEPLHLTGPAPRFVSRGGEKLAGALDRFGVDVAGLRCLDAGSSTGGFTDCLLQRGATQVVAIDVGTHQLHERLRADPRVELHEQTNIRSLTPADLGETFAVVVADLSFISVRAVVDPLLGLAAAGADLLWLVKPQFEVDKAVADRGRGVIRDPEQWTIALDRATRALTGAGAAIMDLMVSPIRGTSGNVEFLVHARNADVSHDASPAGVPPLGHLIASVVAEATRAHGLA